VVDLGAPDVAPEQRATRGFRGWQVVGASFWILGVSSGLGFYALAIYLDALTDQRGFSVGQVSAANFCFFVTGGMAGLLAARLIARHDVRVVMAGGAALAGVALGLIGEADELWALCALYIVFGLGWALCGLVPSMTLVTRWFHKRRSMALSIASTGLSVGGIVCTPIVKRALEENDLASVMPWIGAVFAVAIIPVALLLAIPSPESVGQLPDGDAAPVGGGPVTVTGLDFHKAVHSRYFVCVTAAYVLVMASQVGGISHLVKLANENVDTSTGALVLSVLACASVVARLLGGWVVTKVPMTGFTAGLAALQGVALASLAWVDSRMGMLLLAAFFGITIGNLLMLQPLLIAEAFGVRDYARIYSRSQFVSTLGVAFGPLLLGLVHDAVDGYEFAYTLAAVLSIGGALLLVASGPTETAADRAEASWASTHELSATR
jgi:MFS family permease